ncbi:MAG: TlpA family protein disulfide reductase [Propionibacteriaceae bacterium]|nr:TlpA family protein disulfide reductase [Propionibacteriaceae bacterium]
MTKQSIRNIVVIVVTTVVILAGLWLVKGGWHSSGSADPSATTSVAPGQAAPAVGQAAPDFTGTTVDGASLTLSKLAGQPVWLMFGATWCADCRVEGPDVEAVTEEYAGRVQVVSVYVGESSSTVQAYAQRLGLTMPAVPDSDNSIGDAYGVIGIPAHYFIDSSGVIKNIHVGAITQPAAKAQLDALLGG